MLPVEQLDTNSTDQLMCFTALMHTNMIKGTASVIRPFTTEEQQLTVLSLH